MRSVVVFSILRVLAFAVPFGILMLFPAFQELPWLAAVFAAIIGLALSMLFLRRPLDAVTSGLADRRAGRRAERGDADVEDEVDEAARTGAVTDAHGSALPGPVPPTDPEAAAPADQPTNAQDSRPA